MTCEIATYTEAIITSYKALCSRCCPDGDCLSKLPANLSSACGDGAGLYREIFYAVTSLIESPSTCKKMTETVDRPVTPEAQTCLSADWLINFAKWIDGIVCGGEDCPSAVCYSLHNIGNATAWNMEGSPYSCLYTAGEGITELRLFWNAAVGFWCWSRSDIPDLWVGLTTVKSNPIGVYTKPADDPDNQLVDIEVVGECQ